jgi:hypothetical protein
MVVCRCQVRLVRGLRHDGVMDGGGCGGGGLVHRDAAGWAGAAMQLPPPPPSPLQHVSTPLHLLSPCCLCCCAAQVEQYGPDSFLDMLRGQAQVQEEQQEIQQQQGQQQEQLQGQRQWWDLGPELACLLASVQRDPLMTVSPPGADDL